MSPFKTCHLTKQDTGEHSQSHTYAKLQDKSTLEERQAVRKKTSVQKTSTGHPSVSGGLIIPDRAPSMCVYMNRLKTLFRSTTKKSSTIHKTEDTHIKPTSQCHFPSVSFDTLETENDSISNTVYAPCKRVHWATDADICYVHAIPYEPDFSNRIVILLLHPDSCKFEFLFCEIINDDKLTVSDLLKQLPLLSTQECLASKTYKTLCVHQTELISMLPIQSYQLIDGDVMYALPDECTDISLVKDQATAVLNNHVLRRIVNKQKQSWRSLHRLRSSQEFSMGLMPLRDTPESEDIQDDTETVSPLEGQIESCHKCDVSPFQDSDDTISRISSLLEGNVNDSLEGDHCIFDDMDA